MSLNTLAGFTSILPLTAVVSGLTSTLAFAIVLALTRVFSCVGIDKIVNGRACYIGGARGIRPHCNGTGEEPGNCCSGDHRFRWFHDTISFRDWVWICSAS